MPGRFKAFHYYNAGAVFDFLMSIFRPLLSKKMQDRVRHLYEMVMLVVLSPKRSCL